MAFHDVRERSNPSTDWDRVHEATDSMTAQGLEALGQLIERHRPWLLAHLASRFGFDRHELQDVLHSFIEHKILKDGLLGYANPARGSFRAFLRHAVDNFAISEIRRRNAQKRSPGVAACVDVHSLSASETPSEPFQPPQPSRDIVWAQAVIAGALLDMHNTLARQKRLDIWEVFKSRFLENILNDEPPLDYRTIITRYKYQSPAQALNILVTAKRMFRRHLRVVIAEYMQNEAEVDDELPRLKCILERQTSMQNGSTR